MFIGEAPGADEDAQGEPFVGRAGQLLTKIIETMGFARDDVYIANVLKSRPDMPPGAPGNRPPTLARNAELPAVPDRADQHRAAEGAGRARRDRRGRSARHARPMRDLRGKWHSFNETPLMITYHPSYLLRNQTPTEKRKVWEDMLHGAGEDRADRSPRSSGGISCSRDRVVRTALSSDRAEESLEIASRTRRCMRRQSRLRLSDKP